MRVNIVYVRGTVRRLLPFLHSLLAHTTWQFTAVANGCVPSEVEILQAEAARSDGRVDLDIVSRDTVLAHGDVLVRRLAAERGRFFCCIDSDVFATKPVALEELLPAGDEVATCSCLPMWSTEDDDVMPAGFKVAAGRFLRTSDGHFLGCTYAVCYRTAELRSTVDRWDVPLTPCDWEELPAAVRAELSSIGLRRASFDTLTVANVLLQQAGRPMVYRDIAGLSHLGAQSTLAQDVHVLRRPLRSVAWRWFPQAFHVLWRARGMSRAESLSMADFARRRGEAVRLTDALAAGNATFDSAPDWVDGIAEFEVLAEMLGPAEVRERAG